MDSLQPRDQVVDKRAEPEEKRAFGSSMVRCRSDHLDECMVPLDDPNEEITERRRDGLHDRYTRRDGQVCSQVRQASPAVPPSGDAAATSVRVSNAVPSPSGLTERDRRHVHATPTVPQEAKLSCFHIKK